MSEEVKDKVLKCKVLEKVYKNEYTEEDIKLISEIAREELKFLVRNGIPITPQNFEIWFYIFCYILEELKEIPPDEKIKELFKKFYNKKLKYKPIDPKLLKTISKRLEKEIDNVLSLINNHTNVLDKHQQNLEKIQQKTENKNVNIYELLKEILSEVRSLKEQNEILKTKLQEAQVQISELKEELSQTKKDASIDFLTKVYNRRSFIRALKDFVRDYYERKYPFALLMIDIDHFKKINDTYGHLCGDKVLKAVAGTLKLNLRARDIVGRYGGEEFGVILPGSNLAQAVNIAERLRKAVEELTIDCNGIPIKVTISIGVATMKDGLNEESLINLADEALYLAKRSGRNRVKTMLDVEIEKRKGKEKNE